jgi:subtilisin-like proprotein convertase family protein
MKSISKIVCMIGLAGLAATATGQVYTFTSGDIPESLGNIPDDFNAGKAFAIDTTYVNGQSNHMDGTVDTNSFRVYLNLVGDANGVNSDMYITLTAPTGEMAVLLNRVGVSSASSSGYSDNGLNITLFDGVDSAHTTITDVHWYNTDPLYGSDGNNQGQITGIFKTDGRDINATTSDNGLFSSTARTKTLASFEGIDPNGQWSLYVADAATGGQMALKSWGLDFTPIPEPQQYAMVMGAGLMAFAFYRNRMRKQA